MRADAFRRRLSDAHLTALERAPNAAVREAVLREAIDGLADHDRLFEASPAERAAMAGRAAKLLEHLSCDRAHERHGFDRFARRTALAVGDVWTRADAAEDIDADGEHVPASVAGSLSFGRTPMSQASWRDGHLPAAALVAAAVEVLSPGLEAAQRAVLYGEGDPTLQTWQTLARAFLANARRGHHPPVEARLAALVATLVLRGRVLAAGTGRFRPFRLGAAAASVGTREERHGLVEDTLRAIGVVHVSRPRDTQRSAALLRLVDVMTGLGAARANVWLPQADIDLLTALGREGIFAASGRTLPTARNFSTRPAFEPSDDGSVWIADVNARVRLSDEAFRKLGHLRVDEAANVLEGWSVDPRRDAHEAHAYARFASALRSDIARHGEHSFDSALGRHSAAIASVPMPGSVLRVAASRGSRPARLIGRSSRGRLMRCRAVADDEGRLVGYAGFDPLSTEFHGRPFLAVYGLDGKRVGWAPGQGPWTFAHGEPPGGFVTAPETLPMRASAAD